MMRLRKPGLALAALVLMAAGSAHAADITPKAWKTFVDESNSQYHDDMHAADPTDFEDALYDAAKKTKTQAAAIARFAARMKLTPGQAADYTKLLVDKVDYFKGCDSQCTLTPDTPLVAETRRIAMAEPTGTLLFDVVRDADDDKPLPIIRSTTTPLPWLSSSSFTNTTANSPI